MSVYIGSYLNQLHKESTRKQKNGLQVTKSVYVRYSKHTKRNVFTTKYSVSFDGVESGSFLTKSDAVSDLVKKLKRRK
jgi:hypothetical protein